MRKVDLINIGNELYEVVKTIPISKFKKDVTGETADILKLHFGAEKILKNSQTNHYLFVNLIPELEIL